MKIECLHVHVKDNNEKLTWPLILLYIMEVACNPRLLMINVDHNQTKSVEKRRKGSFLSFAFPSQAVFILELL